MIMLVTSLSELCELKNRQNYETILPNKIPFWSSGTKSKG